MIFAIDATNRAHILYHGSGGTGNIAAMFLKQIEAIKKTYQPEFLFCCFDDAPSFRKHIDPEYKINRDETPQALINAIIDIKQSLPLGMTVELETMEADDLLASFASYGHASNIKTVLVTADKDCRQCLRSGSVSLLKKFRTDRGRIISPQFETADSIKTKYQVTPDQWPDYQALIGDKIDSIIGVPGIGPKRAAELLNSIGPLSEIIKAPARCGSKKIVRELTKFQKRWQTVLKLVTLRDDLPVKDWIP